MIKRGSEAQIEKAGTGDLYITDTRCLSKSIGEQRGNLPRRLLGNLLNGESRIGSEIAVFRALRSLDGKACTGHLDRDYPIARQMRERGLHKISNPFFNAHGFATF
jgi:hypothetical protein